MPNVQSSPNSEISRNGIRILGLWSQEDTELTVESIGVFATPLISISQDSTFDESQIDIKMLPPLEICDPYSHLAARLEMLTWRFFRALYASYPCHTLEFFRSNFSLPHRRMMILPLIERLRFHDGLLDGCENEIEG